MFRGWPERFPATVDVRPLHPPGRGRRFHDALLYRLDEMADEVTEAITPLLDLPYALFGHSMGASMAFEVAQRLKARRLPQPACLVVSARGAPHLTGNAPPIHDLPDDRFLDEVMRMNGTPPDVMAEPDIVKMILPILRADFEAIETYRPKSRPPLDCRLVALGGRDEPGSVDAVNSWQAYATGGFRGELVPGGHFFLRDRGTRLFDILNDELGRSNLTLPRIHVQQEV
ncbi:thioesterase domain protein (plasmid) [Burkholderia humptydooensis]|nr:thioesterase domain protein [Burkholderia sp. 2002721687]